MEEKILQIKFCPKCKNTVAVVKDGYRRSRQCYKCKVCKAQFVEKKYSSELKNAISLMCDYEYKYKDVARIFCVSPNSVRNWFKVENNYTIPDKALIDVLKEYKVLCKIVSEFKAKIVDLKSELTNAKEYWSCIEKRIKIKMKLDELQVGNFYESKYFAIIWQLDSEYKAINAKIRRLKVPRDNLTVEEFNAELLLAKEKYKIQNEMKLKLEAQTEFAREQYDLDELIKFLEKVHR